MYLDEITTEYLIMNEESVNWEQLSACEERDFSLAEIRMFRKRINWPVYLLHHQNTLSEQKLEIASKHFNQEIYDMLACFNIASESFLIKHLDKLDFEKLILSGKPSQELLLEGLSFWKDMPDIKKLFKSAKKFDIFTDPAYSEVKLVVCAL